MTGTPRRPARLPGILSVVRAFAALQGAATSRDHAVPAVLFAFPVLVMLVVGFALRGYSTPQLVVGVVGAEASPAARRLVASLAEDPHIRVRSYTDAEAMRLAVYRGRLRGGLQVPPGWTPDADLPVLASRTGAGTPVLRALLDRAVARERFPRAAAAPIRVVDGDVLGNPPVGYQYTAPANLVLFVMLTAVFASAGIVGFRTTGLGQRLLAAPVPRRALVLGLAVGPVQVMAAQSVFLVAVGALAFGVDWGAPAGVVLVTLALVVAGAGLALFLGTLFRTPGQTTSVGPFLGILLGMLGGCMWPLEVVPDAVRALGHLSPAAWAMDGYLALSFDGAPATDVLPQVAALLAFGALLSALGALRLHRQLGGA